MHLWRGIFPLLIRDPKKVGIDSGAVWIQDVESRIQNAIDLAISKGLAKLGDNVVLVTGWRGGIGNTNTLRIIQITKDHFINQSN